MSVRDDLAGRVFGRLTVLNESGRSRHGVVLWKCRCTCGGEIISQSGNLKTGNTSSCGCYRKETLAVRKNRLTHGESYTQLYNQYRSMIARCEYLGAGNYEYYGALGIKVCRRWRGKNGFENFKKDMGERPSGVHSIERCRVTGNYTPNNCYWATREQQAQNKRNTVRVVYDGEEMSLRKASRLVGIPYERALQRVWRGWSPARALSL
jgi:hypothetical protein